MHRAVADTPTMPTLHANTQLRPRLSGVTSGSEPVVEQRAGVPRPAGPRVKPAVAWLSASSFDHVVDGSALGSNRMRALQSPRRLVIHASETDWAVVRSCVGDGAGAYSSAEQPYLA
jgi:hypothetical protein